MPPLSTSAEFGSSKNPLKGSVEIIPDRLYYCALKTPPSNPKILLRNRKGDKVPVKCFCIDSELVYWNFFLDFGPLNLGQLFRFTVQLNSLLVEQSQHAQNHPVILFYSSTEPAKRTNAIYLICAWQVLEMKRTPEQSYYAFQYYHDNSQQEQQQQEPSQPSKKKRHCSLPPPAPLTSIGQATVLAPIPFFHDASPIACTYQLSLMHCLQGLVKARQHNFFDWDDFNVEEYEYFEQVENGDLNWIIKDKILAFAGPSYKKTVSPEGYCTLAPADYIPYFQSKNVGLVVRLNKKNYEEQDFIDAGIDHLEQFYLDGSCPPMRILQRVLKSFEAVPANKGFAVHCKAGLGRTGTCIGAYMMKHYRMTAFEVISWMRICRPGMVIGPQQQFLEELEPVMWQEGDMMRGVPKGVSSTLPSKDTSKTTNSSSTSKRRSGKSKRDTADLVAIPPMLPPLTTEDDEAGAGRPGQADGLLARRQRQQAAATTKLKSSTPVPVTPDSVMTSSKSRKSGFRGGSSS